MISIEKHKGDPNNSGNASPWEWNATTPTGAQILNSVSGCLAIGALSIAAGFNSTANGDYSVAIGVNNTANGFAAFAFGNNANAIGDDSVAFSGTAIGTFAFAVNSIAVGDYSIAMGSNASATGNYSVAIGFYAAATEVYSVALGYQTVADQPRSTAIGGDSKAIWWGAFAHAQAKAVDAGDRQNIVLNWSGTTFDGAAFNLSLDGFTRQMTIEEGMYLIMEIDIVGAWESGFGGSVSEFFFSKTVVSIYRSVGGALILSNQTPLYNDSSGTYTALFTTSGNDFVIEVTGKMDSVVQWQATGRITMLKVQP